ncbi:CBS domain-containing protein [Enterococcus cecorum]|uniref:CBS domain-containing protein n=1 Tax=Enterococcus cecorum TaxID=44008 RepID=UPI0032C4910F
MELSPRQQQILDIVKAQQPLSGEKIAEELGISRATLRSDLSFLTLAGILQAAPKIGYTYAGSQIESFLFDETFHTAISELMVPPLLIEQSTPIREAITNLFMYNVRAIFVVDEQKMLIGTLNQKDLLRGSLTTSNDQTPVAVCMTRLANVVTVTPEMNILEVAQLMIQHDTEALAVVDKKNSRKIIGKITKSRILAYIVEQAKATELNR